MPGFDGTGPNGKGPMTGGGRGFCAVPASVVKGSFSGFRRLGCGFGGRGRGHRHWFNATGFPGWMRAGYGNLAIQSGFTSEDEVKNLKEEAGLLKRQLDGIQNRINELESQEKK